MKNINSRQVHIFLSSTFADMQSERNHLIKHIFPALKTNCRKRNIDLNIIDLRWGITEEESKTGKVVEICIDEIDRSRPFFIGLLGGRYGWIPEYSDLFKSSKLQEKHPWIKNSVKEEKSITEMEMQYGALNAPQGTNALFFIKEESAIPQKFKDTDPAKIDKLNTLRTEILKASESGKCKAEYFITTKDLGDKFYNATMNLINELYPEETKGPIALIDDFQKALEKNLCKTYIENPKTTGQLNELADCGEKIILVYGKQGSGKSALLANWRKERSEGKDMPIIRMHIASHLDTIKDCCKYLYFKLSEIYPELKATGAAVNEETFDISEFFHSFEVQGNIIWIIDGIDKFNDDESKSLNWLNHLPDWVTCIISTADSGFTESFRNTSPALVAILNLTNSQIISLVESYLKSHAKSLTDQQRVHISNYVPFRKPSTLIIFLEELLQFGIYEELNNYIEHFLSATDEDEFIRLILKRYESDYGEKLVSSLLYTLSLSYFGLTESSMQAMLQCSNLEWAEVFGALSPILNSTEGYINIKDSSIKEIIRNTYAATHDEIAARRSIVNAISQENKMIEKGQFQNASLTDRILYRLILFVLNSRSITFDNELEYLFNRNQTEQICQLYAIGDFKSLKDFYQNTNNAASQKIGIIENLKILKDLYLNGYEIIRQQLTPIKITKLYFAFRWLGDLAAFEMTILSSIILYKNILPTETMDKELSAVCKNLRRSILIPKSHRKSLCGKITDLGNATGLACSDANIAETWIPEQEFNIIETVLYVSTIETMFSLSKIEEILGKALAMTNSKDAITCNIFYLIAALCLIRLGKYNEARKFISKIEISDETELLKIRVTIDLLLFSKTDPEDQLDILLKKFETYEQALQIENHPLKIFYEKYRLACSLQKGDSKATERAFDYIKTNYTKPNAKEAYLIFAEWLYVLRYHEESSLFYLAASETNNATNADKALYYGNIADNYSQCGLTEKSAIYHSLAAKEYLNDGQKEQAADYLFKSAKDYFKLTDYCHCIEETNALLKLDSNNVVARNILAIATSKEGLKKKNSLLIDKAMAEFTNLTKLIPADDTESRITLAKNAITIAIDSFDKIGHMPTGIGNLFDEWETLLDNDPNSNSFLPLKCEYLHAVGKDDDAINIISTGDYPKETTLTYDLVCKLYFASKEPDNRQIAAEYMLEKLQFYVDSINKSEFFDMLTLFAENINKIADMKTVVDEVEKSEVQSIAKLAFLSNYYFSTGDNRQLEKLKEDWKQAITKSDNLNDIKPFIIFDAKTSNKTTNPNLIKEFFLLAKNQNENYDILLAINETRDFDESCKTIGSEIAAEIGIRTDKVSELDKLISYILTDSHNESNMQIISSVSGLIKENGKKNCPENEAFQEIPLINKVAYTLLSILPTLETGKYDYILRNCGIENIEPVYDEDFSKPEIVTDKYNKLASSGYLDKETILEEYNSPIREALMAAGEYESAIKLLDEYNSLPVDELDTSIFIDRAYALTNCGRFQEALAEWDKLENNCDDYWTCDIFCKPLCHIYLGEFIDAFKEIENYERHFEDEDPVINKITNVTRSICLIEQGLINDGVKHFESNNYTITEEDFENNPTDSKALNERLCLYHISLCKCYLANGRKEEATKEMKILDSLKADSFRGIVKIQLNKLTKH